MTAGPNPPKAPPAPPCPPRRRHAQRQDSTLDQLHSLIDIANRHGMYDAADYLAEIVQRATARLAELTR